MTNSPASAWTTIQPQPLRVYQQRGGKPARYPLEDQRIGHATVPFEILFPKKTVELLEVEVAGCGQTTQEEQPIEYELSANPTPRKGVLSGTLTLPAGGWYRIRFRVSLTCSTLFSRSTTEEDVICGPVGVGEVFVIAGQSYVHNAHDSLFTCSDPEGRVVAFSGTGKRWEIARDPLVHFSSDQPLAKYSKLKAYCCGSIWPIVGDALVRALQVPVGFVLVAEGATGITAWSAGGELFARLVEAATMLGDFRAILWQQGETDINENHPADEYPSRFHELRSQFATQFEGKAPIPWLVAKTTKHPTLYSKPELEQQYRSMFDTLWQAEGVFPGPDADRVPPWGRSPKTGSGHLNREGQKTLGLLWSSAILNYLDRCDQNVRP